MADDLHKLAERMRELSARMSPQLASAIGDGLKMATMYGYKAGVDINDRPYIPAKDGHLPSMIRSGTLMNSVIAGPKRIGGQWAGVVSTNVGVSGKDFWALNRTAYDDLLISGTPKMAPREHLPSPGQTPPGRYEHAMDMTVRPVLQNAVDKAVK